MADGEQAVEEGIQGVSEHGISNWVRYVLLGGPIWALGTAISGVLLDVPSTFMAPFRALLSGAATLIRGTLGAPIIITEAGATTSAGSFLTGAAAALGPFAFPLAVAVSMGGVFIFLWFLQRVSFSPLDIWRERD